MLTRKKGNTISLLNDAGKHVLPAQDALLLNEVFSRAFCPPSSVPVVCDVFECEFPVMFPVIMEPCGIIKIIESLKTSSSCGIDSIDFKFLKQTKVYSSFFLNNLFEQSLHHGILPRQWKVGKVVPQYKSGDRHSTQKCRPVSLTCIPCKIMEHVLYTQIFKFLKSNGFFLPLNMVSFDHFHVKPS